MKATGERYERCRWQKKRAERVAVVADDEGIRAKEDAGHHIRDCSAREYCKEKTK